jgi:hypothetical protein
VVLLVVSVVAVEPPGLASFDSPQAEVAARIHSVGTGRVMMVFIGPIHTTANVNELLQLFGISSFRGHPRAAPT